MRTIHGRWWWFLPRTERQRASILVGEDATRRLQREARRLRVGAVIGSGSGRARWASLRSIGAVAAGFGGVLGDVLEGDGALDVLASENRLVFPSHKDFDVRRHDEVTIYQCIGFMMALEGGRLGGCRWFGRRVVFLRECRRTIRHIITD